MRLAVGLNAQQFSNGSSFRAYAPHGVPLVQPGAGSYLGGTLLNVSLSQPAPAGAGTMAAHRMACRFGGTDAARDVQATTLTLTLTLP